MSPALTCWDSQVVIEHPMVRDPYDEDYFDEEYVPQKRDGKIDEAKAYILATFFVK